MILDVIQLAGRAGHVSMDLYGECPDAVNHNANHTISPVDIEAELQQR
jgi:replicative superfamily II helicase